MVDHPDTFGRWVRRRRLSLDLTQAALSRRVGCASDTIKKIEHDQRRPSRTLARRLATVLDVQGEDRQATFLAAARGDVPARRLSSPTGSTGAPPAPAAAVDVARWTSFVGRDRDLAELRTRLRSHRLVTVCGPGGAGKSRLVAELVAAQPRPDEMVAAPLAWVQLRHRHERGCVEEAVARSVGVRNGPQVRLREAMVGALAGEARLLVLDNAEQHVEEVGDLAQDLLSRCRRLTLLVTSRVVTGLPGELRWRLAGLDEADAARLFADRAGAACPVLDVDPASDAVSDICRRLDGLPLGIELAASRADLFGVEALAVRLREGVVDLESEQRTDDRRHRSLRDMVRWSLELLDERDRRCLLSLAMFEGSFDAAAAAALTGPDAGSPVEQVLHRLIAASLVVSNAADGRPRLRLLATVREVLLAELEASDLAGQVRDRYVRWVRATVQAELAHLWSADAPAALDRLALVHDDLEAVLRRVLARRDAAVALELVAGLSRYWDLRGHLLSGLAWLEAACRLPPDPDHPPAAEVVAAAHNGLGTLASLCGDLRAAETAFRVALTHARRSGSHRQGAYALQYLGLCAAFAGDPSAAVEHLEAGIAEADLDGDVGSRGWSLMFLAVTALWSGRLEEALALARRSRRDVSAADDREAIGWTWIGEAVIARRRGRPDAGPVARAVASFYPLHAAWGLSVASVEAGHVAVHRGEPTCARDLLALADELAGAAGVTHLPPMQAWRDELAEALGLDPGADLSACWPPRSCPTLCAAVVTATQRVLAC